MSTHFKAIPTNLITGFLGSGKTTAILQLLKSRPAGSHWAVLVNEFGDVGIDGALLEQNQVEEGAFIKEVPGGCICCAAGLPLQMALNLLIKQANPQRILIEPTGVGHPLKVIETLTGEFYAKVLELRATICLVEAKRLRDIRYLDNETFRDQLNIADVLMASKCDQTTEEDKNYFFEFAQQFTLPKAHIECIEQGIFALDLLDIPRNPQREVIYPDAHPLKSGHKHDEPDDEHTHTQNPQDNTGQYEISDDTEEMACDWRRFENNGQDYYGCGWIFKANILFDEQCLMKWANNPDFTRVKGIFRTESGWIVINRMDDQLSREESTYTSDSRVELIEPDYHDWNLVEQDLVHCIVRYL